MIRRVLKAIKDEVGLQQLIRELGLDRRTVETLTGALLSHGLISEVKPAKCSSCPLAGICSPQRYCRFKTYVLTGKGEKLLELNLDDLADH